MVSLRLPGPQRKSHLSPQGLPTGTLRCHTHIFVSAGSPEGDPALAQITFSSPQGLLTGTLRWHKSHFDSNMILLPGPTAYLRHLIKPCYGNRN
jgi:hypothetical protein